VKPEADTKNLEALVILRRVEDWDIEVEDD